MLLNFFKKLEKAKKNYYLQKKFIFFNRKLFQFNKKKSKKKEIFLIEFNAFHDYHAMYSFFANYIKKKHNYRIVAFFNYCLMSAPLYFNLLQKIKWYLGNILNIKTFAVYRSFNTEDIFRPIVSKEIRKKANLYFEKNFKKIKIKQDVIGLKIGNILIGELLYDSFIRINRVPTVDICSKDFQNYYLNFIELTLFWIEFFEKNNVKGIVTSHTVYSYGLPLRVAIAKKIPCYTLTSYTVAKINKKTIYGGLYGNVFDYKKDFKKLPLKLKKKGIKKAKNLLESRLKHGSTANHEFEDRSSFGPIIKKKFIKNSSKFNVLICTSEFFDAVHYHGKFLFPDFYEWLLFLAEISKKTNYQWYIKNHPTYKGKFQLYQPVSDRIVSEILKKNKHITLLPNNLSNGQIIKEGIDVVLTVCGTVGSEFPFFSIPVVNASHNPHVAYNFTVKPESIDDYSFVIKNLRKLKIRKNPLKELCEFYFMKNLLADRNWLTGDYDKMLKEINGFDNLQSVAFYSYWMKSFNRLKFINLCKRFDIFIASNDDRLQINH